MYQFDNFCAFCMAKIMDSLKSMDLNLKKLKDFFLKNQRAKNNSIVLSD
jgi:hypothetical protein